MNHKQFQTILRISSFLMIVSSGLAVSLVTSVAAIAYAIPYHAADGRPLAAGTIVISGKDSTVRAATQGDGQYVTGIVASLPKDTLAPDEVGVASSGVVSVLASDLNGPIIRGDRIIVSPIEGVGMKAANAGWIVGTAQDNFASLPQTATQQIRATDGTIKTVAIKRLSLLISVSYYNTSASGSIPGPLQHAVEAFAGHVVPEDRAVLALVIFGLSIILLVVLVYSAVKNSLIAIGRNPMANAKITKGLVKILSTALISLTMALGVAYLALQ